MGRRFCSLTLSTVWLCHCLDSTKMPAVLCMTSFDTITATPTGWKWQITYYYKNNFNCVDLIKGSQGLPRVHEARFENHWTRLRLGMRNETGMASPCHYILFFFFSFFGCQMIFNWSIFFIVLGIPLHHCWCYLWWFQRVL